MAAPTTFWVDKDLWAKPKLDWFARKVAIHLRYIAGASDVVKKTFKEIAEGANLSATNRYRSLRKAIQRLKTWTGKSDVPFITKIDEQGRIHLRKIKGNWMNVGVDFWQSSVPDDIKDVYLHIEASWSRDKTKRACKGGKKIPSLLGICYLKGSGKERRKRLKEILTTLQTAGAIREIPTKSQIMAVETHPEFLSQLYADQVIQRNISPSEEERITASGDIARGLRGHRSTASGDIARGLRGHSNPQASSNKLPKQTSKSNPGPDIAKQSREGPADQVIQPTISPAQDILLRLGRELGLSPSSKPLELLEMDLKNLLAQFPTATIDDFRWALSGLDLDLLNERCWAIILTGKNRKALMNRLTTRMKSAAKKLQNERLEVRSQKIEDAMRLPDNADRLEALKLLASEYADLQVVAAIDLQYYAREWGLEDLVPRPECPSEPSLLVP